MRDGKAAVAGVKCRVSNPERAEVVEATDPNTPREFKAGPCSAGRHGLHGCRQGIPKLAIRSRERETLLQRVGERNGPHAQDTVGRICAAASPHSSCDEGTLEPAPPPTAVAKAGRRAVPGLGDHPRDGPAVRRLRQCRRFVEEQRLAQTTRSSRSVRSSSYRRFAPKAPATPSRRNSPPTS